MTSTTTNTNSSNTLPEGFVPFDGQILHLRDPRLTTVPLVSEVLFTGNSTSPDRNINLTGLVAADIDKALQSLPKGFHGDNGPTVPGRARNLVKAAIEDGWIVKIDVRYHFVEVLLHQPVASVLASLRDTVAKATNDTGFNWWVTGDHMVLGRVQYGWDYDADAMRCEGIWDNRILVTRKPSTTTKDGAAIEHRIVSLDAHRSNDTEPKLNWKTFVATVHDHSPAIVDADLTAKAAAEAQRDAASDAYEADKHTPARDLLRDQLAQLRTQATQRREQAEALPMPALSSLSLSRLDRMTTDVTERIARYEADGEVCRTIDRILNSEGQWDSATGNYRLHIDEVLVDVMTTMHNNVMQYAAYPSLNVNQQSVGDLFHLATVLKVLSPLVTTKVIITAR